MCSLIRTSTKTPSAVVVIMRTIVTREDSTALSFTILLFDLKSENPLADLITVKFIQSASGIKRLFFLFFHLTFSFRFQFNDTEVRDFHFFDVTRVEKIAVEFTIKREQGRQIKCDSKPLLVSDCVCIPVKQWNSEKWTLTVICDSNNSLKLLWGKSLSRLIHSCSSFSIHLPSIPCTIAHQFWMCILIIAVKGILHKILGEKYGGRISCGILI